MAQSLGSSSEGVLPAEPPQPAIPTPPLPHRCEPSGAAHVEDIMDRPMPSVEVSSPTIVVGSDNVIARAKVVIEDLAEEAKRRLTDFLWTLDPKSCVIWRRSHYADSNDSRSRSVSITAQRDFAADICIRCFRQWAKAIRNDEDIVDCVTDKLRRKKCESCSARRIACEYIPYDGVKDLRILKTRMDHAHAADLPKARQQFVEQYWVLDGYIFNHPIAAEINRKPKATANKRAQRQARRSIERPDHELRSQTEVKIEDSS
ncbi:hypothetical protein N7519_011403 [Penicillium mononematosum]|uniref:uncharacterized protein n=1 Tax=Penicillium mononematosum TaxID=268346 RepID=UPI0025477433|nr:uncharacterized protein N7519_011403 [Penicillium mononematosum]KAJ6180942.1 hypothetical protein N7519_011403 [Penicillium mononematosum]